jgi:hypothetical protein
MSDRIDDHLANSIVSSWDVPSGGTGAYECSRLTLLKKRDDVAL